MTTLVVSQPRTSPSFPASVLDMIGGLTLSALNKGAQLVDNGIIHTGDATITVADKTGEMVLLALRAPAYLNTPVVRRTIGTTVLVGSMLGTVKLVASDTGKPQVISMPLAIPELSLPVVASPVVATPVEVPPTVATPVPSPTLATALQRELLPSRPLSTEELASLKKVVHYQGSTPLPEAILSMPGSSQRKFFNLFTEYHKLTGERVNLKSAWRSPVTQRRLRKAYGGGIAAGECGSAHAMAAVDIDRRGMISPQAAKMTKLGLFNKHGLWIPPFVGEAWHVEDPDAVYFRYWKKDDPRRAIYRGKVCKGLTGAAHTTERLQEGVFTIKDSFTQIDTLAQELLAGRDEADQVMFRDYLLVSARSESLYGRTMVSKTGALGWWQFVPKTAAAYNLKYPMQLREAMQATLQLAEDNRRALERNGVTATAKDLYQAHMVGAHGLSIIYAAATDQALSDSDRLILDRVVSVNVGTDVAKQLYTSTHPPVRADGVTDIQVATAYLDFWGIRWDQYVQDTAYMKTVQL